MSHRFFQRKCLRKHHEQFTSSTFYPSSPSDQFYDTVEITNPTTVARERERQTLTTPDGSDE